MKYASIQLAVIYLAVAAGCQKSGDPVAKTEPAKVAHHVEEQSLNTITLTVRANQRLGIALAEVKLADVRQTRTLGGEVVIPPGQAIIVSAPIAGTLSLPEDADVPKPGSKLTAGQAVFNFTPLLTAERDVLTPAERIRVAQTKADIVTAQILAQREVETAKIRVEAAKLEHDRTLDLLEKKAGSQRTADAAEAQLKLAIESQTTAEARNRFLATISLDEEAGELSSREIASPVAGTLQSLEAASGETVSAGDPLFQVATLDRLWIRTPVYVGTLRQIDRTCDVAVGEYGQPDGTPKRPAKYVAAPPSANAVATTVDVFYEIDNADGRLYPGQKLAITVPMQTTQRSLIVPFNAVLYDIHGGAWVYEEQAARVYARRRVTVRYVDGPNAILEAGPEPGSRVVTDGAAELFGTEFGVGH